jgi:DNA-binding response OmpR family regulator
MPHTTVLVLAKDRFVAALLGALVELSGRAPVFPREGEPATLAAQRIRADLILLDCALGSTSCASVSSASREAGTRLLMFSAAHTEPETRDIANQHGIDAFALPVSPREFAGHLDRALAVELPASN